MWPLPRILPVDGPGRPADDRARGSGADRRGAVHLELPLARHWATGLSCLAMAVAPAVGGLAAAGAWSDSIAWWTLLVALVLTWVSGLDYARVAPGLLRGRAVA
jgi:hypothetical protein